MKALCIIGLVLLAGCHDDEAGRIADISALEDGGAVVTWMSDHHALRVRRLDVGGRILWETELSGESISRSAGIATHDRVAVVQQRLEDENAVILRAFDLEDGHLVWRSTVSGVKLRASYTISARTRSSLIMGIGEQVVALDPMTGREQHRASARSPTQPWVVGDHAIFDDVNPLIMGANGHWSGRIASSCRSGGSYYGIEQAPPDTWLITVTNGHLPPRRVFKFPERRAPDWKFPQECFGYRDALVVVSTSYDMETTYIDRLGLDGRVVESTTLRGMYDWYDGNYGAAGETTRFMPLLRSDEALFIIDLEQLTKPPIQVSGLHYLTMARTGSLWFAAEIDGHWLVLDGRTGLVRTVKVGGLATFAREPRNRNLIAGGSLWLYGDRRTHGLGVTRLDAATLVPTLPSSDLPIRTIESRDATAAWTERRVGP